MRLFHEVAIFQTVKSQLIISLSETDYQFRFHREISIIH